MPIFYRKPLQAAGNYTPEIKQIYQDSRKTYGSPRIQAALAVQGFSIGRQRVRGLMAQLGIQARRKRKFKATTDSKHSLPIAENLLARNFTTNEPDQAWVADMTYIWMAEGWLYLAVIIDLFSRKVVGCEVMWGKKKYRYMKDSNATLKNNRYKRLTQGNKEEEN